MSPQTKTWIFQVVLWPFYLFVKWVNEKCLLQTFDGIKICDIASSNDEERQKFCSSIVAALELIKKHDPKRYCRVQRHLLYIINEPVREGGLYRHLFRSCSINISLFDFEDSEDWKVVALACTIIHEATHGVMCAHNISYNEAHYLRVERACHQEEGRFTRRFMPEFDMGEFDEGWYQDYYRKSAWQHLTEALETASRAHKPAA